MASNSQQGELFQAETTWFHVFRAMIESGDVAAMGPHAVTCYLVIKSYTNWSTGRSFPALETISEKAGVSLAQVKRSLKTLEEHGYIAKEKHGRRNVYALREKVEVLDDKGRPAAVATWDYLPSSVKEAQAELKRFLLSGEALEGGVVHIEHLTLNVFRDNAQQINIAAEAIDDGEAHSRRKAQKQLTLSPIRSRLYTAPTDPYLVEPYPWSTWLSLSCFVREHGSP